LHTYNVKDIKRVRLIRRADGYYCQFCIQRNGNLSGIGDILFYPKSFVKLSVDVTIHTRLQNGA
ncbi:MAG: hypothetical protein ACKPFF_32025, partial [Planktothrix sp.]